MDPDRPDTAAEPPSPSPVGDAGEGASRPPSAVNKTPAGFPPFPGTIERALGVVSYLREHCEWDRRQTSRTLIPHLLEEAHETAEAVRSGGADQVRDELGDLLLNVAFQIIVAEEVGHFSREDVIRSLEEKMVRRHPHLFGLGDAASWEDIKAQERKKARMHEAPPPDGNPEATPAVDGAIGPDAGPYPDTTDKSVLDSLPFDPDALGQAHAMQVRASEVGFDWDDATGALEKTREEVLEVADAIERGSRSDIHEELGDLLFSVVNLARLVRCHAPAAMASANAKFSTRFRAVESLAAERGLAMPGTSLKELDALWEEVKRRERGRQNHGGSVLE